jgi:hypothetical protein
MWYTGMWRSIETVYLIYTKLDVACILRHMVVVRAGGVAVRLRSSLKRMLLKSRPNSKMDMQPASMLRLM